MATQIKEYSATESALAKLRQDYEGVIFDCSKAKEMKDAKAARSKFVKVRTALEKMRVEIKGPALKHCQNIDSESNRIKKEILELEDSIDQQIKIEENRKAEIKAEKDRKAREEIQRWQDKIEAIKRRPLDYIGASPDQILAALTKARSLTADDFPAELRADAFNALEGAIKKLEEMHISALDTADKVEQLEVARAHIEATPVVSEPLDTPAQSVEPLIIDSPTTAVPGFSSEITSSVPFSGEIIESGSSAKHVDLSIPENRKELVKDIKLLSPVSLDSFQGVDEIVAVAQKKKQSISGLITAAKAACQYLESDPKSRNHIVTKNLRAAIERVS